MLALDQDLSAQLLGVITVTSRTCSCKDCCLMVVASPDGALHISSMLTIQP